MLNKEDLKIIEMRSDLAFDSGKLIGKLCKKGLSKFSRIILVLMSTIFLGSAFFIAGVVSNGKNHK